VAFRRDLVPIASLDPPQGEPVVSVGRQRRAQVFYTWCEQAPATMRLTGRSGLLNHKTRPPDAEVKRYRLRGETREWLDRTTIPSDKAEHPIALKTIHTGLHLIEVTSPGTGAQLDWAPGTVMTMEMSDESHPQFAGEWTLWFYVPLRTKEVAGYSFGAGGRSPTLRDGDGREALRFAPQAGYFQVAVPAGQDGRFWRVDRFVGRMFLLTVPPFVARSPQELLLPKEVVEADGARARAD
jgi:hypothetical protein